MSSSSIRPARASSAVARAADQRDDLVERVQRLERSPRRMCASLLGLAQPEPRAPLTMTSIWCVDPVADERVERQRARHAVDEREHVAAERVLQLGVLVEVVEHDLRDGVALEHDDQAHAGAAGRLVADVGDARHLAAVGQLGDLLGERVGVDLVGQLGDDQAGAALDLLDLDDRAHRDRAAAGAVRVLDAGRPDDQRRGREVRALDPLEQRVEQLLAGSASGCSRSTGRRPRPRAGCAAGCWSPCRPRCRRSR